MGRVVDVASEKKNGLKEWGIAPASNEGRFFRKGTEKPNGHRNMTPFCIG